MAQGGDPLGTGTGGPGYAYGLEASSAAKHDGRGVLSMANSGTDTDTEGSQFFITFAAQPGLDGGYSVFGKLVSGDTTLSAIEAGGTADEGVPVKVTILSATVAVE
jgi:peptidyl-prolyl cis-trans isomerase B (cyclophilin B)